MHGPVGRFIVRHSGNYPQAVGGHVFGELLHGLAADCEFQEMRVDSSLIPLQGDASIVPKLAKEFQSGSTVALRHLGPEHESALSICQMLAKFPQSLYIRRPVTEGRVNESMSKKLYNLSLINGQHCIDPFDATRDPIRPREFTAVADQS